MGYVYLMEFVGPNSRSWAGAHYLTAFSIGFGSLSLIGYYARDWHDMQIWIAVSCAPFFILYFLCPTSYRWLYAKGNSDFRNFCYDFECFPLLGRSEEARVELQKFAKKCGVELSDDYVEKIEGLTAERSTMKNYTSIDLLKWPKMRLISLNSGYCWFVTSMVYYGLGLNAGSLAGSIFINNIINAVMEIGARFFIPFCMEWSKLGKFDDVVL